MDINLHDNIAKQFKSKLDEDAISIRPILAIMSAILMSGEGIQRITTEQAIANAMLLYQTTRELQEKHIEKLCTDEIRRRRGY